MILKSLGCYRTYDLHHLENTFSILPYLVLRMGIQPEGKEMEEVMEKFDSTKAWNLPVVDEDNKYKGFVSKSKMLNTYRQVLVDFSAE